jgi:crossover junction endodeoxyribonuclease RuvC
MMNTAGLDLSLTSTGISINGEVSVIRVSTKGVIRLNEISSKIVQLFKTNSVDCVAIEGYSFASRNSQAHSIGELGGVVRLRLWEMGVPYVEIPPTSRAKFATGRGNAAKNEVVSSVSAKTGLVFSGAGADDMCDAFLLEEMLRVHLGMGQYSWNSTQMSALDKIDWMPIACSTTTIEKEN